MTTPSQICRKFNDLAAPAYAKESVGGELYLYFPELKDPYLIQSWKVQEFICAVYMGDIERPDFKNFEKFMQQ